MVFHVCLQVYFMLIVDTVKNILLSFSKLYLFVYSLKSKNYLLYVRTKLN